MERYRLILNAIITILSLGVFKVVYNKDLGFRVEKRKAKNKKE